MARPNEARNPIVTAHKPITDLLSGPLGPDWTMDSLAEQLLGTLVAQPSEGAEEFVLDSDAIVDRQSRRLLRPLLACLSTKSAAESGTPANLYRGQFFFKRQSPTGPVWILGRFENRPGSVRVTMRRSNSPPEGAEATPAKLTTFSEATSPTCDRQKPGSTQAAEFRKRVSDSGIRESSTRPKRDAGPRVLYAALAASLLLTVFLLWDRTQLAQRVREDSAQPGRNGVLFENLSANDQKRLAGASMGDVVQIASQCESDQVRKMAQILQDQPETLLRIVKEVLLCQPTP